MKRFRLLSDDDGHHYLIPVGKEGEFEAWLQEIADEDYSSKGFDDCRISGSPELLTFTDPKED